MIAIYFRWIAIYLIFNYLNVYTISHRFCLVLITKKWIFCCVLALSLNECTCARFRNYRHTYKTCKKFNIMTTVSIVYTRVYVFESVLFWRCEFELLQSQISMYIFILYLQTMIKKCRWYSISSISSCVLCTCSTCLHLNWSIVQLNAYFHGSVAIHRLCNTKPHYILILTIVLPVYWARLMP